MPKITLQIDLFRSSIESV